MRHFISILTVFTFVLAFSLQGQAQTKKLSYGIKAGVNLSMIGGPMEEDANGQQLEFSKIGFRVGGGLFARYEFNDRIGVWSELAFMQKGGPYKYDGASFDKQYDTLGTGGTRISTINKSLNYLELPVLFYVELIEDKLELSAGPSFGLLAGASAVGNTKYSSSSIGNLEYELTYAYFKNQAGTSTGTQNVTIDGTTRAVPLVLGAYYYNTEAERETGAYYKPFDLGFNAGLAYRISGSLRLGFRYNISLLDITNNNLDYSVQTYNTKRNDFDRNVGYQIYIAFGIN